MKTLLSDAGHAAVRLLEALDASADAFPPLKSAVGGALHIANLVKVRRPLFFILDRNKINKYIQLEFPFEQERLGIVRRTCSKVCCSRRSSNRRTAIRCQRSYCSNFWWRPWESEHVLLPQWYICPLWSLTICIIVLLKRFRRRLCIYRAWRAFIVSRFSWRTRKELRTWRRSSMKPWHCFKYVTFPADVPTTYFLCSSMLTFKWAKIYQGLSRLYQGSCKVSMITQQKVLFSDII